ETESLLRAVGRAHTRGTTVDWATVIGEGRRVDLPTYPFQRTRYWQASGGREHGEDAEFWTAVEAGDAETFAEVLQLTPGQADTLLPPLSTWRQDRRERTELDSWRYRVAWEPAPAVAESAALTGTWAVVAGTPAPDVVSALTAAGAEVVEIDPGAAVPADAAGVLALLDAPGLLRLIAGRTESDIPLWAVTRGAVAVGRAERVTAPELAEVWGLGRVAALEIPRAWGGLVDLPETLDDRTGARLARVLTGTEDQTAVRPNGVFCRRLRRAPLPRTPVRTWSPTGPVLITGGTGALGAEVARWLIGRGATDLVLVGRRGSGAPGADELAASLTERGARVTVVACDVADRDALAELLAEHPVTAVFHAAGVDTATPLTGGDPAAYAEVVRAKAVGARNLHDLLADSDRVDTFVMFSSVAGVWGSGGQSAYAAANAYLDALTGHRRALSLPALSIAWGPWAEAGMAAGAAADSLRRRGLRALATDRALVALGQALDHNDDALVVADVDWARFVPPFTAVRPSALFSDLPEARDALLAPDLPSDGSSPWAARLAALGAADREREVTHLVRGQAAAALGHADPTAVDARRPFKELGFDSLAAIDLRDRIGKATGLTVSATAAFDHPTVTALAAHLLDRLPGHTSGAQTATTVPGRMKDEPIAIVGMACRYPGGVTSAEELWELVSSGADGISAFPADRGWDLDSDVDYARAGGFVMDATRFDAGLFGISPREALAMDPQQRLVLETSWETLERGGIDPTSLRDSRTGVFVGASNSGYGSGVTLPAELEGHLLTGTANSVLSGRIAYTLGLEGPAVTVDTACSSSLVALHWATRALRDGECDLALAGGVTVIPSPAVFAEFTKQGGLAPDGRCRSFAAAADGTGWSEGVG
ncbi:SDR family NAD(P)-dependent oxidoreductase, partial [Streptomyces sp. ACA25]|uniref:SDR family NAD(P)-dependent oxidoreductase n=1 Tax=Streptomyces sp. ACA25 TaxID=3022596 RepID=UPI0023080DC2